MVNFQLTGKIESTSEAEIAAVLGFFESGYSANVHQIKASGSDKICSLTLLFTTLTEVIAAHQDLKNEFGTRYPDDWVMIMERD